MKYSYNVYKIFKNGGRAKAPMHTFESEESEAMNHFNNVIKKNFSGKFATANYKILRADLPQEDTVSNEEEKFSKKKNRALGLLAAAKDINHKYRIGTGLVYCSETDWNWQWAVIESGTGKYITSLSPSFQTHREADNWINNLVSDTEN